MRRFLDSDLLNEACEKVENLDIYNNPAARHVFCATTIDYARHELKKRGLDLLQIFTYDAVSNYCDLWLKRFPNIETDNALIGLSYAIEYEAVDAVKNTSGNAIKAPSN